jgi:hypothetical protein
VDFQLYIRVLWRFRLIVAFGFALALALAFLSMVNVSRNGITYRQNELWTSTVRLLVTQEGFPEGRLYAQSPTTTPGATTGQTTDTGIPVADPARFNNLAILYAELASSDPVRRLVRRGSPVRGRVVATALRDDASGTLLPLIDLASISTSPRSAMLLAYRGANALSTYVRDQQRVNAVPPSDRVVLQTVVQPRGALVYQPRSKTMPIVIFLVVMFAIVGLAFLLESLRPRGVAARREPELADAVRARTA